MIGNPIIRREVLLSLRTRKAVAMQAIFFVITAGLVWLHWSPEGLQDLNGQQAHQIFSILAIGELLMVAMFAPAFTAAALTSEKEHGTFESVFTTAMKPWEIATGKMVGSLAFLVLLVLSGAPALASPLMMGGLAGMDVVKCMGILLLTALYLGMIGLLISAVMHRSYRAVIVTYGVLGVILFLFAMPCWPISGHLIERGGPAWQAVLHMLASFSPLQAMLSVVWPQSTYATGAQNMPPFWMLYLVTSSLGIVVTTIVCLAKLHRPVDPPRPRERLKVIERDGKITARSVMFVIDPRKRKSAIAWWQNPVLVKECRTRPMLQGQWLMRAFSACLIVSVVLMMLVVLSVATMVGEGNNMLTSMMAAVSAMVVVLVVLIGPAMSGGTICGDVESGVWDLMRTTRLSSWRIVSGKFQAAVIPMLLVVLAMLPALMILLYFDMNLLPNIIRVLQVVGMTVLLVTTAGMFFSSVFLRTSTATAWTYGLVVSLGLFALLVMLGQEKFSDRLVWIVYSVNPLTAVLDAAGHHAMQSFGLVKTYLQVTAVAAAAMTVVTVMRVVALRRAT